MSMTSDAASFNGVTIFGLILEMTTGDDDHENQLNSYFGITGIESINGGGRGRRTSVSGVIYGADVIAFAANEALFRSYRDGNAYTLVENDGVTIWPQVMLTSYNPTGRRQTDSRTGVVFRNYSASFTHLI